MLGDVITAELLLDGEVIDTAEEFSVEAYAKKLLKMDKFELTISAEECKALHTLLESLLNSGAEAQKYTDHNTDDLVNEGVTANGEFNPESVPSVKESGEILGSSGAKFVSTTVRFDSTNFIRFDFVLGTASITDVTVEIGGKTYTSASFTDNGDGSYSVYSGVIYATEFDKVLTATIKVSGNAAHSATYSVNSYVKAMYEDAEIGELAKALYFYGAASKAYDALN